jgi:hypothetical protein
MDGVKQLSGDSDHGLQLGLVARLEQLIKRLQVRIPSHRDQRRHVESAAQVAIAGAADAREFVH